MVEIMIRLRVANKGYAGKRFARLRRGPVIDKPVQDRHRDAGAVALFREHPASRVERDRLPELNPYRRADTAAGAQHRRAAVRPAQQPDLAFHDIRAAGEPLC